MRYVINGKSIANISHIKPTKAHTILLTLYHCDMFQPSKGHLQGNITVDTFQQQGQQTELPDKKKVSFVSRL